MCCPEKCMDHLLKEINGGLRERFFNDINFTYHTILYFDSMSVHRKWRVKLKQILNSLNWNIVKFFTSSRNNIIFCKSSILKFIQYSLKLDSYTIQIQLWFSNDNMNSKQQEQIFKSEKICRNFITPIVFNYQHGV
jgi:hypothetical protein